MKKRQKLIAIEEPCGLGELEENPISNPIEPPTSTLGNVAFAAGALACGTLLGVLIARITCRNCQTDPLGVLGYIGGGALGYIATGAAGLVVAAVSPPWRETGLWTAGLGFTVPFVLAVVGGASRSMAQPPPQTPMYAPQPACPAGTIWNGQKCA